MLPNIHYLLQPTTQRGSDRGFKPITWWQLFHFTDGHSVESNQSSCTANGHTENRELFVYEDDMKRYKVLH